MTTGAARRYLRRFRGWDRQRRRPRHLSQAAQTLLNLAASRRDPGERPTGFVLSRTMPELAALADRTDLLETLRKSIDAIEHRNVPFGPQPELPPNAEFQIWRRYEIICLLAKAHGGYEEWEVSEAIFGPSEPTEEEINEQIELMRSGDDDGYWSYATYASARGHLIERHADEANERLEEIGELMAKARGRAAGRVAARWRTRAAKRYVFSLAPTDASRMSINDRDRFLYDAEDVAFGQSHRDEFLMAAEMTWYRTRSHLRREGRFRCAHEIARSSRRPARARQARTRRRQTRSGAPPGDPEPSPAPGDPASSALPSLEALASLSLAWSSPRTASYPRRKTARSRGRIARQRDSSWAVFLPPAPDENGRCVRCRTTTTP